MDSVAEESDRRKKVESPGMRIWRKALEVRMKTTSTTPDEVFQIEGDLPVVEREGVEEEETDDRS